MLVHFYVAGGGGSSESAEKVEEEGVPVEHNLSLSIVLESLEEFDEHSCLRLERKSKFVGRLFVSYLKYDVLSIGELVDVLQKIVDAFIAGDADIDWEER